MLKIRAKKNVVVEAYTMEFYLIFIRMCVCHVHALHYVMRRDAKESARPAVFDT